MRLLGKLGRKLSGCSSYDGTGLLLFIQVRQSHISIMCGTSNNSVVPRVMCVTNSDAELLQVSVLQAKTE